MEHQWYFLLHYRRTCHWVYNMVISFVAFLAYEWAWPVGICARQISFTILLDYRYVALRVHKNVYFRHLFQYLLLLNQLCTFYGRNPIVVQTQTAPKMIQKQRDARTNWCNIQIWGSHTVQMPPSGANCTWWHFTNWSLNSLARCTEKT